VTPYLTLGVCVVMGIYYLIAPLARRPGVA
jgi:hypothetical protein